MNSTTESVSSGASSGTSKKKLCAKCLKTSDRPLLKMKGSVLEIFQAQHPNTPLVIQ